MTPKAACFTGHRTLPYGQDDLLTEFIKNEILNAYGKGYTTFYAGGALGFHMLAALAVLDLRKDLDISLHLALPCQDHDRLWTPRHQGMLDGLKCSAQQVHMLSGEYARGCMHARNRFMVDHSQLLICYHEPIQKGGTAYTVAYATKKNLEIRNLAPMLNER